MASGAVRNLTSVLPPSLRDSIEGYVDAVFAALPEIQREAPVRIERDRVDEFLLVVAIRRIWAAVNNQYWTMQNCLSISENAKADITQAGADRIRGFKLGRDEITNNSEPFKSGRRLRAELNALLVKLEIKELVTETSTLGEIARRMFETAQ